jgi:putative membrane protein
MILKYACVALLLGVAGPTVALAQTSTSGSESGQQFLQQVSKDSMNEIQEALLAEQKAENPCVKAFARLIVDDHTMLESELGAVAHSASFNMASNNDEAKTTPRVTCSR